MAARPLPPTSDSVSLSVCTGRGVTGSEPSVRAAGCHLGLVFCSVGLGVVGQQARDGCLPPRHAAPRAGLGWRPRWRPQGPRASNSPVRDETQVTLWDRHGTGSSRAFEMAHVWEALSLQMPGLSARFEPHTRTQAGACMLHARACARAPLLWEQVVGFQEG